MTDLRKAAEALTGGAYQDADGRFIVDEVAICALRAALDAPVPHQHPDDVAVNAFAEAMRAKLRIAREKGRHGWQGVAAPDLWRMMIDHIAKGDPVDIANFAMFAFYTRKDGEVLSPAKPRGVTVEEVFQSITDARKTLPTNGAPDWHLATALLPLFERARREAVQDMEARKDAAYEERNRVVAALARLFPSGIARTAIEGWSDDWHGCVYIDTPEGQLSWHFHDSQAHLFDGLPPYAGKWDGHSTDEKYQRVARLREHHLRLAGFAEGIEAAAGCIKSCATSECCGQGARNLDGSDGCCGSPDYVVDLSFALKAIRSLAPVARDGWRGKSAQPDGRVRVLGGRFDHEGEWIEEVTHTPLVYPFTHWRPLPAPPAQGGE